METMSLIGGIMMYGNGGRYESDVPPTGRKVIFLNDNGHDYERERANTYFKEGDILTIKEIYVDRWNSDVEFIECPKVKFNTVMFKDI